MKDNPNIFGDDFEFLLMNNDILHEVNIDLQTQNYTSIHGLDYSPELVAHYTSLVKAAPIFMMSID
jgi:hypothetical protein